MFIRCTTCPAGAVRIDAEIALSSPAAFHLQVLAAVNSALQHDQNAGTEAAKLLQAASGAIALLSGARSDPNERSSDPVYALEQDLRLHSSLNELPDTLIKLCSLYRVSTGRPLSVFLDTWGFGFSANIEKFEKMAERHYRSVKFYLEEYSN